MIQSFRIATSGIALAAFALLATGTVQGWPLPSSPATGAKLYADRLPAVQERDAGSGARSPRTCSAWPYEGARCVASVTVEERPEPGLSRLVRVPADLTVAQADTAGMPR
ncbi:hypothetical protein [Methylobacterium oryzihabitans]|uniref:Uncharacterized protein n=1 Tax=Methylobacterium oryzihabitans TaxID=2499852 RepID=A0A437NVH1_9HYPH|nr:hypothetical protein [Methylobacterium oryzihabitans]RVU13861.1 hypothetical protein EOE48_25805 [Methylobacterium oryzihabitans]